MTTSVLRKLNIYIMLKFQDYNVLYNNVAHPFIYEG